MASPVIDGYLFAWKKNQDYAPRLVADLEAQQMVANPASNVKASANHPAWVLSHLNVYLPVICSIIKGEIFEDPKPHKYGMQSQPIADVSQYADKEQLSCKDTTKSPSCWKTQTTQFSRNQSCSLGGKK